MQIVKLIQKSARLDTCVQLYAQQQTFVDIMPTKKTKKRNIYIDFQYYFKHELRSNASSVSSFFSLLLLFHAFISTISVHFIMISSGDFQLNQHKCRMNMFQVCVFCIVFFFFFFVVTLNLTVERPKIEFFSSHSTSNKISVYVQVN